jgi:hypothetical protein
VRISCLLYFFSRLIASFISLSLRFRSGKIASRIAA